MLTRKLARLRALSARDQWALMRLWLALLFVAMMTRYVPYRFWRHWLKASATAGVAEPPQTLATQALATQALTTQALTTERQPEAVRPQPCTCGQELARVARLLGIAERHHFVTPTCLTRAIAARWHLARDGVSTTLKFGAAVEPPQVLAHAWVACDACGLSLGDEPDRYVELSAARSIAL